MTKKRALGRGLSELMGDLPPILQQDDSQIVRQEETPVQTETETETEIKSANAPASIPTTLGIDRLVPGKFQPRRRFDDASLDALAISFAQNGILQPLLVRRQQDQDGKPTALYEIIAGERRWRAAQRAGFHEVPILVRDCSDAEALEMGLVENVQRSDLNPMEEAEGYQRLADDFNYIQTDIAKVVGKSRSHIANMMRLIDAPTAVRDHLISGQLSTSHARALLGLTNGEADVLVPMIVREGLNVRATEALAKEYDKEHNGATKAALKAELTKMFEGDADIRAAETKLREALGLSVVLKTGRGESGTVRISYKTLAQFDDLVRRITGSYRG